MGGFVLSYLAGSLSTLSPCVLPLVPILIASALQSHRFGPVALAGGLALSYAVFGIIIAAFGQALGIDDTVLRATAAAIMIGFGLVLLIDRLKAMAGRLLEPLAGGAGNALNALTGQSLGGQFAIGALLGAVWAPCVGPTLGAAITVAAQGQSLAYAATTMLIFGLGAATPVLALAYGSRGLAATRRATLTNMSVIGARVMGGVLVLVGVSVIAKWDKAIEAALVAVTPEWLLDLTTRF